MIQHGVPSLKQGSSNCDSWGQIGDVADPADRRAEFCWQVLLFINADFLKSPYCMCELEWALKHKEDKMVRHTSPPPALPPSITLPTIPGSPPSLAPATHHQPWATRPCA